jgi:hypothetical protein
MVVRVPIHLDCRLSARTVVLARSFPVRFGSFGLTAANSTLFVALVA